MVTHHRTAPPLKMAAFAAVFALIAIWLTGCVKTSSALTLASDDTFTASAVTAFEADFIDQAAGAMGKSRDQLMSEIRAGITIDQIGFDLGEAVITEDYDEGGYIGWRFTSREARPIAELNENSSDAAQMTVGRVDDQFTVQVTVDLTDAGVATEQFRDFDVDPAAIADQIVVELSFTFPGPVISGNGEIDGNTITFTPPFGAVSEYSALGSAGGPPPVSASAEPTADPSPTPNPTPSPTPSPEPSPTASSTPSAKAGPSAAGGFPTWPIFAAIGLVLAVAAAVIWRFVARRKAVADAVAPLPASYGPLPAASGAGVVFRPGPIHPSGLPGLPGQPGSPDPRDPRDPPDDVNRPTQ
ncbi:MAG: hypothetical protein LBU05_05840 [Bifidobacteriaceae bacterium]|jgi:hypothetical protein|nr:hypothetical protein [Bifidobacteriaceae bacterium]